MTPSTASSSVTTTRPPLPAVPRRGPRLMRGDALTTGLQLGPVLLVMALFVAAPLVVFLVYSFWRLRDFQIVAEWNLDNYRDVVTSDVYRNLLWNTVRIAGMTSIACVVVGYAFAHVLRFHLRRFQERLLLLVIVAAFSGYLVRIYAWRTILGDDGIVNRLLTDVGVIDRPLTFLLFNRFAAVLVLTSFILPVAILATYASLQNIRDSEIEAARDLGAGAFTTFRRVVLPLAWPGIFGAFALAFVFSAGDYLTPLLVGGTSGTTVGRAIADAFNAQFDWPQGAALSFTMLVIVGAILALVRLVGDRALR